MKLGSEKVLPTTSRGSERVASSLDSMGTFAWLFVAPGNYWESPLVPDARTVNIN